MCCDWTRSDQAAVVDFKGLSWIVLDELPFIRVTLQFASLALSNPDMKSLADQRHAILSQRKIRIVCNLQMALYYTNIMLRITYARSIRCHTIPKRVPNFEIFSETSC